MMKLILFQRDSGLVNRLSPAIATLLCVIVSVIPVHLPGYAAVTPAFTLMAVYHWTIYRPDLLPLIAVFASGLLLDLLNGAPLGISSLVLLLIRGVVASQRPIFAGQNFVLVWAGFLAVCAMAFAAEWALFSLYYGTLLDFRPSFFQGVLTVAAYPGVSYLLARLQRSLLLRA